VPRRDANARIGPLQPPGCGLAKKFRPRAPHLAFAATAEKVTRFDRGNLASRRLEKPLLLGPFVLLRITATAARFRR
jgi:hypothetical protein